MTCNKSYPFDAHCCHTGTGYIIYTAPCARRGQAVICNIWHPGTLTLRAKRQSARMSKITNDGLTRSSTGCSVPIWQFSGRQRVISRVGAVVRASDFWSGGRGFDSPSARYQAPRSTQPSIPPGSVNRVPAFTGWGYGGVSHGLLKQ